MRFATIQHNGKEQAAVWVHGDSWAPLDLVDPDLAGDLLTLIAQEPSTDRLFEISGKAAQLSSSELVLAEGATYRPPYRRPHKIWGIGLNYREHAADLSAEHPTQPASFIKGDHTIIGPGDEIVLPPQSERVTGEAEIGLVIGRSCRSVDEDEALDHVFGVCPILDQTAEDILGLNPRYLTRSKNFPTFFSFGPEVVTLDEFPNPVDKALGEVTVATVLNSETVRSNTVANMAHGPSRLVSFHSEMMPLFPGDLISTGTPGAAVLAEGDAIEAHITGMRPLTNPVRSERETAR